jgi:hypothetical protein
MTVLPDFVRYFDVTKMGNNLKDGDFFTELDKMMRFAGDVESEAAGTAQFLPVSFELVRVVGEAVGQQLAWLERCPCHDEVILSCNSYPERLKKMRALGLPSGVCPWQGRRTIEMALGHRQSIIRAVESASSDRLQLLICRVVPKWRPHFVMLHRRLVTRVCDNLSGKLSLWDQPPFRLMAALGEYVGAPRRATGKARGLLVFTLGL